MALGVGVLLGAVGAVATVVGVFPEVGSWVKSHGSVGWWIAFLLLVLWMYREASWAETKDQTKAHTRRKRENQDLRSTNDTLTRDKQSMAESLRSVAAAGAVTADSPKLHLDPPDPGAYEDASVHYPLPNENDGYRIDGLSVHTVTPGVRVISITDDFLNAPQGASPDAVIVDVEFAGGRPTPWEAIISYDAVRHCVSTQAIP